MSLMYLVVGPLPLTAHFLDNPGIQCTQCERARERESERARDGHRHTHSRAKRESAQTQRENRAPDLHCLFMTPWHARCVNNLGRNLANRRCLLNSEPSRGRWENREDQDDLGREGGRLRAGNAAKLMGVECVLKEKRGETAEF